MVRFVNSGTEAAMSAIRLARAATGRDQIVKCIGCYHGHVDGLLVQAGSGALTLGTPCSPGIPNPSPPTRCWFLTTIWRPPATFRSHRNQIACFIVEPVAGNMGVVPPGRRLSARPSRALRSVRRAAAFRRSDDRLPRRLGRRQIATTSGPI